VPVAVQKRNNYYSTLHSKRPKTLCLIRLFILIYAVILCEKSIACYGMETVQCLCRNHKSTYTSLTAIEIKNNYVIAVETALRN